MSLDPISASRITLPSGVFASTATLRFPRFILLNIPIRFHQRSPGCASGNTGKRICGWGRSPHCHPSANAASTGNPRDAGCSTLMTSTPSSASSRPASGPAHATPNSSIRVRVRSIDGSRRAAEGAASIAVTSWSWAPMPGAGRNATSPPPSNRNGCHGTFASGPRSGSRPQKRRTSSCGSSSTSTIVRRCVAGTPAACSVATASEVVRVDSHSLTRASISPARSNRSPMTSRLGSARRSNSSMVRHSASHCCGATATTEMNPSAQRYSATGCDDSPRRFPHRRLMQPVWVYIVIVHWCRDAAASIDPTSTS